MTDVATYMLRLQHEAMASKQELISGVMSTDVHYLTSILQHRLLPLALSSEAVSYTLHSCCL